jgi:Zn-dependent peptidase ImmA (M78 family)
MLELESSNVPYITNQALDSYAEKILRDFKPALFDYPQALEVDDFLEFHLELEVEYRRLTKEGRILGMTIFNDGVIQVFNHITEKLEFTHVKAGTIFIDTSLTGSASTTRRRFTCAHEASHWLLHRTAFASKKWNSEYMVSRTGQPASVIRKDSENRKRMEQQANFLAAALLMPKTTMRMLFCEFCKDRDIKPRTLILTRLIFARLF